MLKLTGYTITEQIYQGIKTSVYRGYRQQDNLPVIIKTLPSGSFDTKKAAQFYHEYEITKDLNLPGIIKIYELQHHNNNLFLILEDIQGESLKHLLATKKVDLSTFLHLAIHLADNLAQLHTHHIIHKDIKPANLIVNLTTWEVKITDFSISSVLSIENQEIKSSSLLEGTLAYMSPEQTGRMNRALDYRTDFYSLGIVFYEMLVGHPPFISADAIELVHCHLAKRPIPPHQLNPTVPKVISHIIMKLLAKTAEARYQSAHGLKADLQACWQQLQATGKIEEFAVGHQDISDKFHIPQQLYGRETELNKLLLAFERVSQSHTEMMVMAGHSGVMTEIMLVAGYSGIGKSKLVQEIYKPITEKRGYFITGKFDQFQRNVPYSAVVNAFSNLVQQLLTESEDKLKQWRNKLLTALGANAQIITDVIPEIEWIIGKQPPVQKLGMTETQNRFNLVFQNFIHVFCLPEHPLVLFLDDLQWADSATLKLIELIMSNEDTRYLFFIGAYRDNEVDSAHPLILTLQELQGKGVAVNQVTLAPLTFEHISQLIAETLHRDRQTVKSLAELVMQKTQGNPFFVNQFLKTLYEDKLLQFIPPQAISTSPTVTYFSENNQPVIPFNVFSEAETKNGIWHWDVAKIQKLNITDNVVELMIGKVKKLPTMTQQVLRLAACIGSQFDLSTLAIVYEHTPSETFQAIKPALQEGLVLSTQGVETTPIQWQTHPLLTFHFQFLHDRVQQAAYTLIEDSQKQTIHLQIGQLLLANTPKNKFNDHLFEIVDHLNRGNTLITDSQQQLEWVRLNIMAGKKAKEATAYFSAQEYLTMGMTIPDLWHINYELALELYREKAEVEYLTGNFLESQASIDIALAHIHSALDKADFYNLMVLQYTMLGKYDDALTVGRQLLAQLGLQLPEKNLPVVIDTSFHDIKHQLTDQTIASLIDMPNMTLPQEKAIMKLLANMGSPAYFSVQEEVFAVIATTMVNLSLQHGHVPESCYGYAAYAMILSAFFKEYRAAYEFGMLALKLSEKLNDLSQKSRVCSIICGILSHWVTHLEYKASLYNEGYQAALESGDLRYAGYMLMYKSLSAYCQDESLETVLKMTEEFMPFLKKTKNQLPIGSVTAVQLAISNLLGLSKGKYVFNTDTVTETQYLKGCQSRQHDVVLCFYYIFKAQILYLYEQYEKSLQCILLAKNLRPQAFLSLGQYNLYYSLNLLALYPKISANEKQLYRQQLDINQKDMKIWAEYCPINFRHKYLLVEAELARLEGKELAAVNLYDEAIALAQDHQFTQHRALANHLAAKFWLEKGKEKFAQLYMTQAYLDYHRWGAKRLVTDLEEKYPTLIPKKSASCRLTATDLTITAQTTTSHIIPAMITLELDTSLDLTTIIKASQTISRELLMDNLFKKMMRIVMENVGAEEGWLILRKSEADPSNLKKENKMLSDGATMDGGFFLVAYGTVDEVTLANHIPLKSIANFKEIPAFSQAIVQYAIRTQKPLVLHDARYHPLFANDAHVLRKQPQSILCHPIIGKNQLIGLLYLENNLTTDAFTQERLLVLQLLATQIAISLENAFFYAKLQQTQYLAEQARQVAEAANRAKSSFLANMSHELRTPLNAILGYSAMIQEEAQDLGYEEIFADLEKIQTAGNQLLGIISDILDISKIEAEKVELNLSEFEVCDIIQEVVTTIQPLITASGNNLIVQCQPKLGSLYADAPKLIQILLNLLNNAAKFTHNGTITLAVIRQEYPFFVPIRRDSVAEKTTISTMPASVTEKPMWVCFSVSDTGIGIAPEMMEVIFKPFTQVDNSSTREYGGTGLGLTISDHFCRAMGGAIVVESELGIGSTFTVQLPTRMG